jgi:hypothetical protein
MAAGQTAGRFGLVSFDCRHIWKRAAVSGRWQSRKLAVRASRDFALDSFWRTRLPIYSISPRAVFAVTEPDNVTRIGSIPMIC